MAGPCKPINIHIKELTKKSQNTTVNAQNALFFLPRKNIQLSKKGRQIQEIYFLDNKKIKKLADLLLGWPDGPLETWKPTFCHISETLKKKFINNNSLRYNFTYFTCLRYNKFDVMIFFGTT
jgi:hypothetical protein